MFRTTLPEGVSAASAFAWHAAPGAFERLMPPWERMRVFRRDLGGEAVPGAGPSAIGEGARLEFGVRQGPLWLRWVARHGACVAGSEFNDVQERGPFAAWKHRHKFMTSREGRACLEDDIEFALPLGAIGEAGFSLARATLRRMFWWRHLRTARDLARHAPFAEQPRLRVAVSGMSGQIGSALAAFLSTGGHTVVPMVRAGTPQPGAIAWDWERKFVDERALEGVDAVVHLAGAPVAGRRWSEKYKKLIRDSRVEGTRLVASALSRMKQPPATLILASGIGYYGHRGNEACDESMTLGTGFLAEVSRDWEEAARPAEDAGVRVVRARIGMVLSPSGGALAKLILPTRLGLSARLGSGTQYVSWIGLDDCIGALHHAIMTPALAGPVNVSAPEPVMQHEFAQELARALGRWSLLAIPEGLAELAFGEIAREVLLRGSRAEPGRLAGAGFGFLTPTLAEALAWEMGVGRDWRDFGEISR